MLNNKLSESLSGVDQALFWRWPVHFRVYIRFNEIAIAVLFAALKCCDEYSAHLSMSASGASLVP